MDGEEEEEEEDASHVFPGVLFQHRFSSAKRLTSCSLVIVRRETFL